MRNIIIPILCVFILFSFCKKNSTSEKTSEDIVTLKVYVEKGGNALFNAYVETVCTINMPVSDTYNLGNTRPNPVPDTQTFKTGRDGYATLKYQNKSLVGEDAIYLTAIEVSHQDYGVIYENNDLNIKIDSNTTYTYEVIVE